MTLESQDGPAEKLESEDELVVKPSRAELLEEREHTLWEEWSDHREGSSVRAAIIAWASEDLDVSSQSESRA
jgi:hypothetical protein